MSLISVIIPVYNVERYINRCIDSILNQTFSDFELILVDDGSKDRSGLICDDYKENDTRINVIHKKNGGASSARNAALDIAGGEYIMFVDSDDWLEADALEKLYNNSKECSMVVGGYYTVSLSDKKPYWHSCDKILDRALVADEYIKICKSRNMIVAVPWGKLYKNSVIKENNIRFDTSMNIIEDSKFNIDFLQQVENVCFINDIVYNYNCVNEGSLTNKYWPDTFLYRTNYYKVLEKWFKSVNKENLLLSEKQEIAYDTTLYYCLHYKNNKKEIDDKLNEFYFGNDEIFKECKEYVSDKFGDKYRHMIEKNDWGAMAEKWKKDYDRKNMLKNAVKRVLNKAIRRK